MNSDLEEQMWKAGSGEKHDETVWRAIIDDLLAEFRDCLSQDFTRDADVNVDSTESTFRTWIWSKSLVNSPVSVSWSGILAGSPIGDPQSREAFVVTIDVFLFHEMGQKRLFTNDGLQYLLFSFDRKSQACGAWRALGWQKDEWGEWKDLVFPE